MRIILAALLIALLAVLSSGPAYAQTAAGQIAGRVIDADTNAPIAGARVQIFQPRPISQVGPPPMSTTDEEGRFVITGVAVGRARVSAQKPGYTFEPMDAQSVDIVANQAVTIEIRLRRGGVLAGRVLDERGEPLADLRVTAMRRQQTRGGTRLVPAFAGSGPGASTNDLGEFRLAGLPAGEYVIVATTMPQPFGSNSASTTRSALAPTYYPGVTLQESAQSVSLQQNDTLGGLEFRMQTAPAFRVSGVVVDENGQRVTDAMVNLRPASPAMPMPPQFFGARVGADGTFAVTGVFPGSYVVTAQRTLRTISGAATFTSIGGGSIGLGNGVQIDVRDADIGGVRVVAATPRPQ